MNAPTLYLAFPYGEDAVVCRVLDWSHRDSRHQDDPRPLVAAEVPGSPGAYHLPHILSSAHLREAVVSDDPETARSVIHDRQVGEWITRNDEPDALSWEDDDQEEAS